MNRRVFLRHAVLIGGSSLLATGGCRANIFADKANVKKPNIVFVLADDMGYGDVQCLNNKSKIPTPNLDSLAKQGMTFTDAHSGSAVCTPTRYGVVTGRYCWRTRLKSGVLSGTSQHLIDTQRLTVASLLKQAKYQTACIGKWHLGMDLPMTDKKKIDYAGKIKNSPNVNGFDYFYGVTASLDMPPYVFVENDSFTEAGDQHFGGSGFPKYIRPGDIGKSFKHIDALDQLVAKGASFIKEAAKKAEPYFLYLPLTAPHKPTMPAERFQGKSGLGPYGDFIIQTDWAVGQIIKAVDQSGQGDNTLFIFTSDNASYMYKLNPDEKDHVEDEKVQGFKAGNHTANYVFRGTNADVWEGGHHVPYLVRWPDKVKAGAKCDRTICLTDLMATCGDVVDLELPENAGEDGFSILSLLLGKESEFKRAGVVNHSANGTFALRQGKWKLIFGMGSGGRGKPGSKPWSKPYQLYDLEKDIIETNNLVDKPEHKELIAEMEKTLQQYIDSGRSR
ncbi:MAG: arylsulfatase [Phycisphaerae bacterium]|nr:arylsulfatase [Phycisphaerae bacterium]